MIILLIQAASIAKAQHVVGVWDLTTAEPELYMILWNKNTWFGGLAAAATRLSIDLWNLYKAVKMNIPEYTTKIIIIRLSSLVATTAATTLILAINVVLPPYFDHSNTRKAWR